jgi:hypothetical protein
LVFSSNYSITFQTSIEKTIRTTFGPVDGEIQVFIKDISMPLIKERGDQGTNEIVQ